MSRILAERGDGGPGAVSLCGGCDDVHVRWGEVTLSLSRARFLELVRMLNAAARPLGPDLAGPSAGAVRGTEWTQ
ncbi:MAG: hypothetical protein HYX59_16035 [Elusimicrobia bacterium]|nr:hypothetical protein [Elusimicrobiota bacterium]